uniref:Ribonuclease n=1 Tax=Timema genevievae TaxID=629358 RepID=A0A7R9K6I4_TIMGE|nr:unnamed protein product [Timema genevievae]
MTSESEHKNTFYASTLSLKFSSHDNSSNLMLSSNVPRVCIEEPCILGVDEAGRGPVLGPMVYGICYCPISKVELLKDLGCADSKTLTEEKRKDIFNKICQETESLGWIIEAIAPNSICNSMLKRQKYSLNQVAQDSTVLLIKKAIETGVNVTEVYVDTVGPSEKYQDKLLEIFPHLKITVAKKADSIYPIVSAASICAKVSRDEALKVWTFPEQLQVSEEGYGSGYPNGNQTKQFPTSVLLF